MQEIEELFCRAIDLMVDQKNNEAEDLLEEAISILRDKLNLSGRPEEIAQVQELWGDALALMSEPEQALLHYEKGVAELPDNQTLLWKICRTLLDDLEKYDEAETLLRETLLPLDPENSDYLDALDIAKGPQRYKELEEEDEDEDEDEEEESVEIESEDALDHCEFYSGTYNEETEEELNLSPEERKKKAEGEEEEE